MPKPEKLSAAAARRIALAAQGLTARRPSHPGRRHLTDLATRLGMYQIDSVNVLARAHLMPAFARLGPYDLGVFERAAWGGKRRAWFEYWGHAACLIPLATWPLLQWRMAESTAGWLRNSFTGPFIRERGPFIAEVLAEIRDRGALAAADLTGAGTAKGKWWGWSDGKMAIEYLFATGQVAVAHRRGAFERVYDLPERVLPAEILAAPVPDTDDAQRRLLRTAAAAMGVATETQLRDYWRLKPAAKPRVAELVESGELLPVAVDGWKQPGLLWHEAKTPRRVTAHALLSPFDPLLWERDRALGVLDFHYRIGLYTPREKRTDGYYVLPFLFGDRIGARVDLKADRQTNTLHVHATHAEPNTQHAPVAEALARELRDLARWLNLETIEITRHGNLAAALERVSA